MDWGLTPVRATAFYSNEGLVAGTISPCVADRGRVSAIGVVRVCCADLVQKVMPQRMPCLELKLFMLKPSTLSVKLDSIWKSTM